jgi:hypothetical protein
MGQREALAHAFPVMDFFIRENPRLRYFVFANLISAG